SPFIEPKSPQVHQATVSSRDEMDQAKTSAKRQKAETIDRNRPTKWQDVELVLLSDYQLQVRNADVFNYAELGFADRRGGKEKPNSAWLLLRKLAESGGHIMIAGLDPKRSQVEKQVQQIRSNLRQHFGLSEDPLSFTKDEDHVGYHAKFKISCSPSYQK